MELIKPNENNDLKLFESLQKQKKKKKENGEIVEGGEQNDEQLEYFTE